MNTILFGSARYDLVDDVNVSATRLQATIYKGESSVEQIAENTTGVAEIKVYDDDTLLGVYDGYTDRIAISLYEANGADVVSVELQNADVMAQLDSLADTVALQSEAITELGEDVSDLNESQGLQDGAIEDLANDVSTLFEE